jgi:hypothetical protein
MVDMIEELHRELDNKMWRHEEDILNAFEKIRKKNLSDNCST